MKTLLSAMLLASSLTLSSAQAKVVQIIHTNDLHSYFAGTRDGLGGYAKLKTKLDELRSEAQARGIPSIHLDAGDFGEGSSYYFSGNGVDALRALDLLGVDAVVLGNHDYMFGGRELRRQLIASKLKAKILTANMIGKKVMGLSQLMPDFVDIDVDGLKVRVFGLTTPEMHYQYPLRPLGYIEKTHKIGIRMANRARKEGVDFLIALTHTGFESDVKLVTKSSSVDLVVGGHDHSLFEEPRMIQNLKGRFIPVLQAGAHGIAVGSLIMDVQPGGHSRILEYKVHRITADLAEDEALREFTKSAHAKRNQYFERDWDEVIGHSEIILNGNHNGIPRNQRSCWSRHVARLTRVTAKADLGLQWDNFQGEEIQPGPVTFGDMVDNFPHVSKWGDHGWSIAKARIPGFLLKRLLNALQKDDFLYFTIDGLYTRVAGSDALIPFNFRDHDYHEALINGKPILDARIYSLGLPSEVPGAMKRFARITTTVLLGFPKKVKNGYFWPLLEDYIRKNSPIRCLED